MQLKEEKSFSDGYKAALDDVESFILLAESGRLDDAMRKAKRDEPFFSWLEIILGYRRVF